MRRSNDFDNSITRGEVVSMGSATGFAAVAMLVSRARVLTVTCVALLIAAAAFASSAQAAGFGMDVSHAPATINRGDEYATYTVTVTNSEDAATSGPTSVLIDLPDGTMLVDGSGTGWTCVVGARVCSNPTAVASGANFPTLTVGVYLDPDTAPDIVNATFTAFGGGTPLHSLVGDSFTLGPRLTFGLSNFVATANDALGDDYTQAGGHPFSANTAFDFNTHTVQPYLDPDAPGGGGFGRNRPTEEVRDAAVNLPLGFVANPSAMPGGCLVEQVTLGTCPARFAVGRVWAKLAGFRGVDQLAGVYKVIPEKGYPAEFAFRPGSISPVTVVLRPKLRPGDFGITALAPLPPQSPVLFGVEYFQFCSYGVNVVPATYQPAALSCKAPGDPGALKVPFMTNPTRCDGGPPVTSIDVASYQNPGAKDSAGLPDLSDPDWKTATAVAPEVTGCDQVPFEPSVTIAPTTTAPDAASGLDVDLEVPQDGLLDPDGIATSHLKKTVVKLPQGLTVNPSAASGLQGCSDAQIGIGNSDEPACPDASKLGIVEVVSPLLDRELLGEMYLATPKSTDPASGEMLRLFIVVRNDDRGILVKLPGSTVADPQTGQLTATFDNNPRLPFDTLKVKLRAGDRGVLATPQDCGEKTTETTLTPWSGTGDVDQTTDVDIAGDCAERFAPDFDSGSTDGQARGAGGTFSFKFSRQDGEQWLRGLTATLPKGLLASVKDVPLCSNAQAGAGDCPDASKIGIVDAKAGAGDPFVLEQKGELFLTEGYKGGEYGLAVKVRPVAGPFRGDMELSPIVVRQAIHVDRATAQVTAISDPFPIIHHGIPLRVREVNVLVNRSGFMLNPSDCDPKQVGADLTSTEGATANLTDPFQMSSCSALPFEPKLALTLTGRRQVTTGTHPGIRAQVTQQGVSEAGIEKAVVRLPKSLALDPNNAQALCEFEDGTKPDLENHCPAGSIVGRARANLRGESDTTNSGKLVNTFDQVPDAPISRFNLNIKGGKTGIIAVTRTRRAKINLCAGRHVAEADMDGHNGRRHDRDVRMKTPCTKKQTRAAKRQVRRAAAGRGR